MKKIAIVTGASSGMGREFVRQLHGFFPEVEEIWVIARRMEGLQQLEKQLWKNTESVPVRLLPCDLCDREALNQFEVLLKKEQPKVLLLVNSAGVGKAGCFSEISRAEAEQMVRLNDGALVSVTHLVLPYICAGGRVIQMASASAFLPQREFAVYAASKAFVLSFSRALGRELRSRKIFVTTVCPGPVATEFLRISNGEKEMKPLKRLTMAKPEPVVTKALKDAKKGKELSIYGVAMKLVYIFSKLLPQGWMI